MNNRINGAHGKARNLGGPLTMSPKERHDFLARFGMAEGWLILTRAEFLTMRTAMDECQKEVDRLTEGVRIIKPFMGDLTSRFDSACSNGDLFDLADICVQHKEAIEATFLLKVETEEKE